MKDKRYYLLDVFRRRLEYRELERMVKALAEQYRAAVVLIEDRASGMQLIQELKNGGLWSAMIENGYVLLPQTAPWLPAYLHELTTFPNAKHDDQAGSTAQDLTWFTMLLPEPAILTYCRREVEELGIGRPQRIVSIKGPTNFPHLAARSGQQIYADSECISELMVEDAKSLLCSGRKEVL